jgi:prevent-host-death family protein
MTATVNMHEAKTHFSKLVERALAGEDIVVAKAGKPCIRLVPIDDEPLPPRTPGRFKGQLTDIPDALWFSPYYSDAELDQFDGDDAAVRSKE